MRAASIMSRGRLESIYCFMKKNTVGADVYKRQFLMWFGNTTIILMAAIMGVDPGLYLSLIHICAITRVPAAITKTPSSIT